MDDKQLTAASTLRFTDNGHFNLCAAAAELRGVDIDAVLDLDASEWSSIAEQASTALSEREPLEAQGLDKWICGGVESRKPTIRDLVSLNGELNERESDVKMIMALTNKTRADVLAMPLKVFYAFTDAVTEATLGASTFQGGQG